MPLNHRSQISFEYVLIFVIILAVTIPSFFLFRNFIYESNDNIIMQNVDNMANQLLSTAVEIQYQGVPSKIILNLDVPRQIKNMSIAEVKEGEYYLIVNVTTSNREVEKIYKSDVPIRRNNPQMQGNCYGSTGTLCKIYYFNENEISPGKKNFKILAQNDGTHIEAVI